VLVLIGLGYICPSVPSRVRVRGGSRQRGLASAQCSKLLVAKPFGVAYHGSHSVPDEYPAELRIGRRGGDVTQPQADGCVRLRIYVDLLKGCFQQALKVDSSNARANDAGRMVEQLLRWLSGREEDQDAAQLIDAVDDSGGSLTAGEIAFNATSTICRTPNSTSGCNVLVGPKSNTAISSPVPSEAASIRCRKLPNSRKRPFSFMTSLRTLYSPFMAPRM
jgi:hypothetical protein